MDGLQNGPGISLFQGSGSLEINTNDQEEEEAIADKRRMDQELQNLLTNAFDDLIDEDDQSTINSSLHLGSSPCSLHLGSSHHDEDENENYNASYSDGSGGEYNAGQHDVSSASQHNNSAPNNRSQSPTATRALEEYMNRRNLAENRILVDESLGGGDASVSMLHYQHCARTGSIGFTLTEDQDQHNDKQPTGSERYTSTEQLQVLYEVRVREVRRLAQQLEAFDQEKDQLLRKVALREAEKEHAQVLYKQAQGLLVEHKERIRELEKQVEELQATVASLEKSKSELSHQLEVSQASVMDLHSKISLLERANFNNTDKHMDAFLRNVQASHSKELKKLENQLESTATKLSKKEYELEQVQKHSEELARNHEALMVEKAETINQLSRKLEESQRQCQQLMGSVVSEEVIRLRVQLENALKDKEVLENQKQDLQKELEALRMDIQQYDAIAKLGLFRPDESVDEADSIVQLGIGNRNRENGSGGIPHLADLNAKLRSELQRCLIGQRLKREEISRLKAQLTSRERSVAALQKQEAQYLVAVEKLKAEYVVLIKELNSHRELAKKSMTLKQNDEKAVTVMKEELRAEFEASLNSAKEECTRHANLNEQLQQEIKRLQKLMDEDKKETINHYSEEYLKFHDQAVAQVRQERDREHEAVVAALRYELEDARKELDRVKELYIKVCGSKDELLLTLQQERKASQELKSQLEKLNVEMQAFDEAERARAALFKINSEKEKLESERRSLGEVQTLQQELEKERAQYETAMLKIQEDRKKLEAEQETLANIHSLQQELEKEKAQQEAALLKLGEERSKLEAERRALGEIQDLKLLLEREKDQHKAALAKLEEERRKLQTLQHQLEELKTQLETSVSNLSAEKAKTEALDNELKAERNRLNEMKNHHENEIESMMKEHKTALLEMEEKARNLYAKRVTEEIEKAKHETLAELERDWRRKCEEKEANRQDSSTSPVKNVGNMDVERLRKELSAAFQGQVTELQLKHKAALEQTSERIKNETVRFFAEQIRQLDAKHRVDLQRVQQVHMETVASLRKTLVEEHTKCQLVTGELQKMQQALEMERNQGPWKIKAEMLSQQVLDAEKISETYRSKYRAAKKTALRYKQYAEAKEKHLNSEWQRINKGFQEALEKVQSRLESLLESKGFLSDAKMVQCSEQIKELQDNLDIK